jgi:hypothetical protein
MTESDTTTLTGAQFREHVGSDPVKWAKAFLAAYTSADGLRTDTDRAVFVAGWFDDAMEAAVAEAVRRTPWPSQQCPPTP